MANENPRKRVRKFYANKRDKNGEADHKFEIYCKGQGIHQILCSVGHPQTREA